MNISINSSILLGKHIKHLKYTMPANSYSGIMERLTSDTSMRQKTLKMSLMLAALVVTFAIPFHHSPTAVYAQDFWNGHQSDEGGLRADSSIHSIQVDTCNTISTATSGSGGNGGDSGGGLGGNADGGSGGAGGGAESNGGNGHGGSSFAGGTTSCSNHATNVIGGHR